MYLEMINQPNDIKNIDEENLDALAAEIREFLVDTVSEHGGHLASNLGAVELTIALHRAFDLPKDKIIWDVGHQSYTHKLLTGRKDDFAHLREFGGMSGFPKRKESDCDAFDTGHSSTSISAALGYVQAREIKNEDYYVTAVIGDGSLTGGMAFEALNNTAALDSNLIVILNDNNMSISKNVGGMSAYLNEIRTAEAYTDLKNRVERMLEYWPNGERMVSSIRRTKSSIKQLFVPGMFFEDMGITYLGPVDGHNLRAIQAAITDAKRVKGPVLVHVITKKGKGYEPAELDPSRFHGTGPFDKESGKALAIKTADTNTDVFSKVLTDIGHKDPAVVAITAAMEDGTGLKAFHRYFPDRFFDVGISEQHAVTFAAGLAAAGMKPVFAVYSSFLQRAFDQVIHDVCLQNLPVVFAVDRAGLVGNDGETHQGQFDMSFMSMIPNMTVMSPKNKWELADMTRFAVKLGTPVCIRYPRGTACDKGREFRKRIKLGESEAIFSESEVALLSVGHMFETALGVHDMLHEAGVPCSLENARFVKPINEARVLELAASHKVLVTIEENVASGGYAEHILEILNRNGVKTPVITAELPDGFVEHGSVTELQKVTGLNKDSIFKRIMDALNTESEDR